MSNENRPSTLETLCLPEEVGRIVNNQSILLTPSVAEKLIQELFAGQTVKSRQIKEKVDAVHEERGGQLSSAKSHLVHRALGNMKKDGRAGSGPGPGYWVIFPEDSSESKIHRVESLNAFMEWVEGLPSGEYVYRGVSNKDYPTEVSSDRFSFAISQINFTENPLVALWMACRESSSGFVDGRVYAIDIGPGGSLLKWVSPDDALKQGYKLYHWQQNYQESRMLTQEIVIQVFEGCDISEPDKQKISDSLKTSAGISEDTLLPDFQGYPQEDANEADDAENQKEFFARTHLEHSLWSYQTGKTDAAVQYYRAAMEMNPATEDLKSFYRKRAAFFFRQG